MTWANSTGETVDQADVALGYVYGPAGNLLTGANDSITSTDPAMPPANWSGSFGMELPAPTAVAIGVAIPGVGVGTAEVVPPDMPTSAGEIDPLNCVGELQLIRGDDYTGDRARRFTFASSVPPQPSDVATWTWTDPYCDEAIGELTTSDFEKIGEGEYVAKFEATSFASDNRPGQWPFDVQLSIANADTRTIVTGILDLIVDQTR